jgi:hypothetical protein
MYCESRFHLLTNPGEILMSYSVGGSNMELMTESATESDHRNRIWFFPDKFWQATKHMPKDEATNLMAQVEEYAAAGNVQALSKYPFVFVGDPYKKEKKTA